MVCTPGFDEHRDARRVTTPGQLPTVVLLPPVFAAAPSNWPIDDPDLTDAGVTVIRLSGVGSAQPPYAARWVATTAAALQRETSGPALVLVARGAAGVLVPQLSVAVRARRRQVAGYGFVDAWLPRAGATLGELADVLEDARDEVVPGPADWPDAPCAYAMTQQSFEPQARVAQLRAWPVIAGSGQSVDDTVARIVRILVPQSAIRD